MQYCKVLLSVLLWDCVLSFDGCPNVRKELSQVRKRRHLAFPDGTDMVLTASLVKAFMTHAPAGWNIALELDVHFPLPDSNFTSTHLRRKLHHRQKKDMWMRLEEALDFHNLDGRACVLQSICEAKIYLKSPGKSLVHDILKAIFTVPEFDKEFAEEIRGSYDEIFTPHYCERIGRCPFSLMHFILNINSKQLDKMESQIYEQQNSL